MPDTVPGATGLQQVMTTVGRREWAQFLGGLITGGNVAYFKLGEGGWNASSEVSESFTTGTGSPSVGGTIDGPPLVAETVEIDAGTGRVAYDLSNSPWDGSGVLYVDTALVGPVAVGTVNYKTNAFSVVFPTIIPIGQDVVVSRRHRGQFSGIKTEDVAEGDGGSGPYTGTLGVFPVVPGSVRVTDTNTQVLYDDGVGGLSGAGGSTGSIDYDTGDISVTFGSVVNPTYYVRAEYRAQGVPRSPNAGVEHLFAEDDDTLATIQKSLTPSVDMAFQGAGTGEVDITIGLTTDEGNDDGTGNPPFWTEGALFSDNDVVLMYFTFPGVRKTNSDTFERVVALAKAV